MPLPPGFRRVDRPLWSAVDRIGLQTNHQDSQERRAGFPDLALYDLESPPNKLPRPWSWLGQDSPIWPSQLPLLSPKAPVKKRYPRRNKYSDASITGDHNNFSMA